MTADRAKKLEDITAGVIKSMQCELFTLYDKLELTENGGRKLDAIISDFLQDLYFLNEKIKDCYWTA